VEGLLVDLRQAFRGLRRDRAFAVTAVAMLAIAIALNVTVFTVMDAMLFRGLPLATRSDRLVYLGMRKPSDLPCCSGPVRYADFEAWRAQARAFEDLAFGPVSAPITFRDGDGRPIDMAVSRPSANTFGLLGVRPIVGRDFEPADEVPGAAPVAIISYRFWERRFGKRADIVGVTVHVNGAPAAIVGVMPERFALVYEQDLWMPLSDTAALEGGAIGRLRDGATLEEARAELDTITRRLQADDPATVRGVPSVQTYSQAHVTPDAPMIYGSLWAGSWFVLLIACANVANLMLVRTIGRWREFSTRLALGAGQARMVRQMLVESAILTGVAGALGWWITKWSVHTWAEVTASTYLALDYRVTFGTLAYLVAISVAAGFVISLVPIARVIQLGVNGALKGDARGVTQGSRAKYLTTGLVAGQMALAIVLLLGAGVLVRSFENIVGADTGVRDPEHILVGSLRLPSDTYPTPSARTSFFGRLETQLRTVAGGEEVSVSSTFPTRTVNRRGVEIEGRPGAPDGREFAQFLTAGPGYFRVMGVSGISGRDFDTRDDAAASPVVIVNQSFAEAFWPGKEPVGQRLRAVDRNTPGPWRTVVGVVPNIMQGDATRQTFQPVVYIPFRQQPSARAFVFLRTSVPPNQVAPAVRAELQRLDPDVLAEDFSSLKARFAFDRDFMDLEHAELGKHAAVAPIFAVVALLLAATGLYAVIAHAVSQRTKEIGVRMAIGAADNDIRWMVLRQGLLPVWTGALIGLTASVAVNRVLQSQLVGVSPYDPMTMIGAPVLLVAVAVLACRIPVRRALSVEPVIALRHE
jgi:putative ABC transport system permease protein